MSHMDLLRIERSIRIIRGDKVILDEDRAELYGVETRKLVQAVKRNPERFPADFMFQLTNQEFKDLRSQFVTSSQWGGKGDVAIIAKIRYYGGRCGVVC